MLLYYRTNEPLADNILEHGFLGDPKDNLGKRDSRSDPPSVALYRQVPEEEPLMWVVLQVEIPDDVVKTKDLADPESTELVLIPHEIVNRHRKPEVHSHDLTEWIRRDYQNVLAQKRLWEIYIEEEARLLERAIEFVRRHRLLDRQSN